MADETPASAPEGHRHDRAGSVTLGLIPAPDIPEKIAGELPELLGRRVDANVSWEGPVVTDPLTGSGRDAPEILDVCRERMLEEGWNLAVCLTDLPVYRDGRLVAADVGARRAVAGLSLPALGAVHGGTVPQCAVQTGRTGSLRPPIGPQLGHGVLLAVRPAGDQFALWA